MLCLGFTGKTSLKEKWYGTEYNIAPFDRAKQVERWTRCVQGDSEFKDSVSLPLKNPFVPTDFTIRSATSSTSSSAAGAVVGGAESAVEALETRAKPSLLEYVTTVTPVSEDADDTEIDTVVDATAALSVTEGTESAPVAEATEGQEEGEEEEEVEEEEEPEGPVPALQGKVNTSDVALPTLIIFAILYICSIRNSLITFLTYVIKYLRTCRCCQHGFCRTRHGKCQKSTCRSN
jgi:hypothetical protein